METQDIIALISVYVLIVAALGLSLYVEKKGIKWDTRKIVHIGVGAFIYIWWAFTQNWIMLAFFAIPFAIVLFFAMIPGNVISNSKLGELTNDKGHKYGLFLYVVSICLLVAFFFDHWMAATIAIVAMTRGDGYGSIVGKRFGRHKIINGKSLEGSLGVFLATTLFSIFVLCVYCVLDGNGLFALHPIVIPEFWLSVLLCVLAGVMASVIEAVTPGDFDNLLIPMSIAVVLSLLGM